MRIRDRSRQSALSLLQVVLVVGQTDLLLLLRSGSRRVCRSHGWISGSSGTLWLRAVVKVRVADTLKQVGVRLLVEVGLVLDLVVLGGLERSVVQPGICRGARVVVVFGLVLRDGEDVGFVGDVVAHAINACVQLLLQFTVLAVLIRVRRRIVVGCGGGGDGGGGG